MKKLLVEVDDLLLQNKKLQNASIIEDAFLLKLSDSILKLMKKTLKEELRNNKSK